MPSLTAIEGAVDASRPLVSMAIGWLAREGKVEVAQDRRATVVWLTEA